MSKLDNTSMKFHLNCVSKLKEKEKEGYFGWDDPAAEDGFKRNIQYLTQRELSQKNLIHISNFCMFLWNIIENKKEIKR